MEQQVMFTRCDNHPARGGSHKSKALIVRDYFNHNATLVMCTAKTKHGYCGNEYLVPGRSKG